MYTVIKRGLDIVFSLLLLIVLSPLFFILAVIIHADSDGQIIFRQERVGQNGRPFTIYKFRTMLPEAPESVATALFHTSHRYITPVGRFLRQTSLDELPQLFNVLIGNMSFVGPRPVIAAETNLINQRRALGAEVVRPGITGLAQIRGRDQLHYEKKARYDAEYAHHVSFWLDAYILLTSIWYVLRREGIREGSADLFHK